MQDAHARQARIDKAAIALMETVPNAPVEFCLDHAELLDGLLYGRPGDASPVGLLGCSPLQTLGDSISRAMKARHA